MAYPTTLDTTSTIPVESASTPLSTNHVANHTAMQTAIIALETKLGIDSSAVTTSHDYKLSEVTSTDKAVGKTATQTLTNKTLTSPVINVGSDAEGDIYYRNSGGAFTRLAKGTDNYILKMNGNVPNWEAETVITNASTTVAGISELATAAEITAGTAAGGSGAALVVTPDQLALATPVFNGSALTNVKMIPEQRVQYDAGTDTVFATNFSFTTDTAGTIGMIATTSSGAAVVVYRLVKDTLTGLFLITHVATFVTGSSVLGSISCVIAGSYGYAVYNENGTSKLTRFDIADMANGTAMTYSGTAPLSTGNGAAHSDGTDLYIYTSSDTYYRYTISGTTATNAATITYTSGGDSRVFGSACDGTSVWMSTASGVGAATILKYALAGGSSSSSATYYFSYDVFPNYSNIKLFHMKSGVLGLAQAYTICSAAAVTGIECKLNAITTP